jgi:ligand-binding SRPBCC domain-containing protein
MVTIDLCTIINAPLERCFDLARCIEVHVFGTAQTGEQAVDGVTTGLIGPGEFVRWRAKHLGVRQHLSSRITEFDRPGHFQDTMIDGAFRSMQHDHFFKELAQNTTQMRDRFVFAAPLPLIGVIAEAIFLRRYMTTLLIRRNEILKQVAESDRWKDFLPM